MAFVLLCICFFAFSERKQSLTYKSSVSSSCWLVLLLLLSLPPPVCLSFSTVMEVKRRITPFATCDGFFFCIFLCTFIERTVPRVPWFTSTLSTAYSSIVQRLGKHISQLFPHDSYWCDEDFTFRMNIYRSSPYLFAISRSILSSNMAWRPIDKLLQSIIDKVLRINWLCDSKI